MANKWTIKVWWSDGRETEHTADTRAKALDVISGEAHPYERYELTGGLPVEPTLAAQGQAFVDALNARARELAVKLGRKPTYRNFGFEVGRKYARIFWSTDSGQRSALAFVDANGVVRRSDSWKQAGRILGRCDAEAVIAFVAGPL